MTNRLAAYVTDPGYLLPSLISALQLAEADRARTADIAIFTVSVPDEVLARVKDAFAGHGFKFIPIDAKSYAASDATYFREGHVPRAALGRLVLSEYVPAQYEHIVYIDGDTQIRGDVSPLLNYEVPEGKIAAVSESFFLGRLSPQRTDYLTSLGLDDPADYFNSGVLAFRNSTWKRMGPEALDYFQRNPVRCQFHDQSALNAVCRGRRVALAPAYNFHTGFAELAVAGAHRPRIVHFTGSDKPWNRPVWPWDERYARPYKDVLDAHPSLAFALKVSFSSPPRALARRLHQIVKHPQQYADLLSRRRKFNAYVRQTAFAV